MSNYWKDALLRARDRFEHDGRIFRETKQFAMMYDLGRLPRIRKEALKLWQSIRAAFNVAMNGSIKAIAPPQFFKWFVYQEFPGSGDSGVHFTHYWVSPRALEESTLAFAESATLAMRAFAYIPLNGTPYESKRKEVESLLPFMPEYPAIALHEWFFFLLLASKLDPIQVWLTIRAPGFLKDEEAKEGRERVFQVPLPKTWQKKAEEVANAARTLKLNALEIRADPFFVSARTCEILAEISTYSDPRGVLKRNDDGDGDGTPADANGMTSSGNGDDSDLTLELRKKELRAWLQLQTPHDLRDYLKRHQAIPVHNKKVRLKLTALPGPDKERIINGIKNRPFRG